MSPLFQPLDEANDVLQVVQESVRNFDGESYHRGNPKGFPLFLVAGGGLMSSVISTIHPNPPLKRRACGKTCLALLRNMNGCLKVADKAVRNFDMVSY